MPKSIKVVLSPAKSGFTGKNKPAVAVISSPHDPQDAAVRYSSARDFLDARGFRILNRKKISFNEAAQLKPLQTREKAAGITIWLEAHGVPGWLFGRLPTIKAELEGTVSFANFVIQLARQSGASIDTVVLSCCHSGTEFVQEDTGTYFNSPARLLSCLLPGVSVIGFVGTNVSAKITHVFENDGDGLEETIIPLHEGGIMFKDGFLEETTERTLYCASDKASDYLDKVCGIKRDSYFEACAARERLAERGIVPKEDCFGERQLAILNKMVQGETEQLKLLAETVNQNISPMEVTDSDDSAAFELR